MWNLNRKWAAIFKMMMRVSSSPQINSLWVIFNFKLLFMLGSSWVTGRCRFKPHTTSCCPKQEEEDLLPCCLFFTLRHSWSLGPPLCFYFLTVCSYILFMHTSCLLKCLIEFNSCFYMQLIPQINPYVLVLFQFCHA